MGLRIESNAEPIPGYRLLERLGAGGFGEVWKAEAPGGLLKAIKIVRGDGRADGEGGGLADQELKALRRVQSVRHPYLLSIDRYDVIDGHLLIVTELADGSLWDRWLACRRGGESGLSRDALIRYLAEAAEVLDLMHTKHRLQHLDIKPQNLFLIHDHVKVADFGLVKDLHGVQGVITGGVTPFYAAPETFNDVVSQHCDQYSLAIVYCELLTGARPFAGGSAQMVMVQHLQVEPNLDRLPECDRAAVAQALAKSPGERFRSCIDFVRGLGKTSIAIEPSSDESEISQDPVNVASDTQAIGPITEPANVGGRPLALVIGLGGVGGTVVQRLRAANQARGGDRSRFRLLAIDTDNDALADLQTGHGALDADEVLPVPLRRAAHYLKVRRDGRRATDGWFDTQSLGRLAREPATQGVRALGRLAFVDHDRALQQAVAERVRSLMEADGSRSRDCRVQVHLVSGLAGGTGSGLGIDVAYLAQQVLHRYCGSPADVHGWLLVPPLLRSSPAHVRACANTMAFLQEVQHFSLGDSVYRPVGTERDAAETEKPPFASLTIVPLSVPQAPEQVDGIDLAANGLARELTSSIEYERLADLQKEPEIEALSFRSLGSIQYSWPRQAILDRSAVRTSMALVGNWLRTEPAAVRDAVQSWFADAWAQKKLGPEHVMQRLHDHVAKILGQSAESVLAKLVEPNPGTVDAEDSAHALLDWLVRIDDWVGRPADGTSGATPGSLGETLLAAFRTVSHEWSRCLSDMVLATVDIPEFRLAGADVAARIAIDAVGRMTSHFGPLADEWLRKAADSRIRAEARLGTADAVAETIELSRAYPGCRWQGMLVGRVAAVYQSAQNSLTEVFDYLAVCRQQLETTHRLLSQSDVAHRAADPTAEAAGWLLPESCRTIDDAANRVVASISWDDVRELEGAVQVGIVRSSGGLLKLCASATDAAQRMTALLNSACREWLMPRVDASGAAEAFVGAVGGIDRAVSTLCEACEAAQPTLGAADGPSATILELPPGRASDELTTLAVNRMQPTPVVISGAVDAIVVTRECSGLLIHDIPHLGPEADEAFDLVCRADGISPHARFDIDEWVSAEPIIH